MTLRGAGGGGGWGPRHWGSAGHRGGGAGGGRWPPLWARGQLRTCAVAAQSRWRRPAAAAGAGGASAHGRGAGCCTDRRASGPPQHGRVGRVPSRRRGSRVKVALRPRLLRRHHLGARNGRQPAVWCGVVTHADAADAAAAAAAAADAAGWPWRRRRCAPAQHACGACAGFKERPAIRRIPFSRLAPLTWLQGPTLLPHSCRSAARGGQRPLKRATPA